MQNLATQTESFRRKFHYFSGWSYVDFKRFAHFTANNAKSTQVSFLCPNRAHQEWLVNFLTQDLLWDSKRYKILRGENYGGHSIVMVHVGDTFVEESLSANFQTNLALGEVHFLRGYMDHQVITPKYFRPFNGGTGDRANQRPPRFQPYSTLRAQGIRLSFSCEDHMKAFFDYVTNEPELEGEIEVPTEQQQERTEENKFPLLWEQLNVESAIHILSWLATADCAELPRFGHFHIITKLARYIKRDGEPIVINSSVAKGYGFTQKMEVTRLSVDPGIWGGPIFVTVEGATKCKIPSTVKSSVELRVSSDAKQPEVATLFLQKSSRAEFVNNPLNVHLIYFGAIEAMPDATDLEMVIHHRFKDWVISKQSS